LEHYSKIMSFFPVSPVECRTHGVQLLMDDTGGSRILYS
jgi:hypothetical protein